MAPLLEAAAQKDPGFDLYWFAVALNRAADLADELERWPIKMLVELSPTELTQKFEQLAMEAMTQLREGDR